MIYISLFQLCLFVFDCVRSVRSVQSVSCAWLCLIVFGCFWLFLVVFGCFWLFLVVFGCFWLFLVAFGCF